MRTRSGDNRILPVDAGLRRSAYPMGLPAQRTWRGSGTRDMSPEAIVLTHGHADHSGSAAELSDSWDVPVYAHRLELPFFTGLSAYPPPDPTVGGPFALLSRFMPPFDGKPRCRQYV